MRRVLHIVRGLLLALVAAFAPRALASGEYKGFVVVYDGWGTPTSFAVSGRVLEDQDEKAPDKSASESVNIIENIKALESDEIRFADLQVNVGGTSYTATSDDDGNFKVQVKNLPAAAALSPGLLPVTVTVTKVPGRDAAKLKIKEGKGNIYIYDDKVPFTAIVSDVDDTIVKTYVTDKKKLIGAVLLKNAHQLEPVVGASDAYQRAKTSGVTGYFYLSGSPQNFYLRIQSYLAHNKFPAGPLLLKNLGDDNMTKQQGYKVERLEGLLQALPSMRIVVIGDSGEHDPEIYAELRKKHPERVVGIVIRKTPGSNVAASRFAGMTTFDDAYPDDAVIARLLAPPLPTAPVPAHAPTTPATAPLPAATGDPPR